MRFSNKNTMIYKLPNIVVDMFKKFLLVSIIYHVINHISSAYDN